MKDNSNELRLIVGENIRHCREEGFPGKGGMSKCAEKFGVSIQQWSPWELGKRLPKEERLKKIAEFFGRDMTWMLTRHNFDSAGDDHAQRIDINLGDDDMARFFKRFEHALMHSNCGDIVVTITMKPRRNRKRKKRESV